MSKGWDNATLKKLKALTGKGLSTSEIGKRLGMSKNAVVGKLNRLGWNLKAGGVAATAAKTKEKAAPKASAKKETVKKEAVKKVADVKARKKAVEVAVEKKSSKKEAKPVAVVSEKKETKVVKKEPAEKKTDSRQSSKSLAMHQRIIQHSLEMANLKPNQCRWPIGDPDSENFHFCGEQVFVGKPYCYEHCKQAYQFAPPKKKN